jgi:hypothetical protein
MVIGMQKEEIIVIGAGASGMMAAITAAAEGGKVLLIEKLKEPGKKLLATGNGKCNFTNSYQQPECYRGEEPEFIREALAYFSYEDVLRTFHEMGILPRERDGYYYPASGQAASVVEAFLRRLNDSRVSLNCQEKVLSLKRQGKRDGEGFFLKTDQGEYQSKKVIIATGGMAAPVHGTTGDGYALAKSFGLALLKPLPALSSCVLKGDFAKDWAGVRIQGEVFLHLQTGECIARERGELQMVSYGLSGIPVFQVSRYASRALECGDKPYLMMDMFPDYTVEELREELYHRIQSFPKWTGVDALDGMIHRKLAKVLLKSLGMDPGEGIGKWSREQTEKFVRRMKGWKLGIAQVSGFEKAQTTCGGVLTNQLDPATMEVKKQPGLYMTGELLDVDGICGGYNLQWAWTSGYLAGKNAAKKVLDIK